MRAAVEEKRAQAAKRLAKHLRNAVVAVPGIGVGTGIVLAAKVVEPVLNLPTGDHSTVGTDARAVLPVIIQPTYLAATQPYARLVSAEKPTSGAVVQQRTHR